MTKCKEVKSRNCSAEETRLKDLKDKLKKLEGNSDKIDNNIKKIIDNIKNKCKNKPKTCKSTDPIEPVPGTDTDLPKPNLPVPP